MSPWLWVLAALALLLLLLWTRVGVRVRWDAGGLMVHARIGPVLVRVYPAVVRPERNKKEPKKDKKKEAAAERKSPTAEQLLRYLALAAEAAGGLKERVRVDDLTIGLVLAGKDDPAAAAIAYGGVNSALGMILPLLEQNFQVKERRVSTAVDFQRGETAAALEAALSLRVLQLLTLGVRLLVKLSQQDKTAKNAQKEAVQHGKQQETSH